MCSVTAPLPTNGLDAKQSSYTTSTAHAAPKAFAPISVAKHFSSVINDVTRSLALQARFWEGSDDGKLGGDGITSNRPCNGFLTMESLDDDAAADASGRDGMDNPWQLGNTRATVADVRMSESFIVRTKGRISLLLPTL